MKTHIKHAFIAIAAAVLAWAGAANARTETVTSVHDGDTFAIKSDWGPYHLHYSVRVRGVDTPEIGSGARCPAEQAAAEAAQKFTFDLITRSNNKVRLNKVRPDKYGTRLDADVDVWVDHVRFDIKTLIIASRLGKAYNGGKRSDWCAELTNVGADQITAPPK